MSRALTAWLDPDGVLRSPTVGTWLGGLPAGAWVKERGVVGTLGRLGVPVRVLAPDGAWGQAEPLVVPGAWVQHGTPLLRLGVVEGGARPGAATDEGHEGLLALRAPMSGTLYLRPKPGVPDFAPPGAALAARATVALVEVMKTFTPLTLEQPGVLERWLVVDGASVEADQVLAWIRPSA